MKQNTRHIFFKELDKIMAKDKDVMFLTGDLGYSYMEGIQQKYPDQFINCGCIEQSMVGIASGLALAGKKPYVYSTVPFILFRAWEQVRNDISQQKFNVKLIGVSMSGFLGWTHNMLHNKEDINMCKNIKLKHYIPKNNKEVKESIIRSYKNAETAYIRL